MDLCSRSVTPGESPPPPPRVCFGRTELIDKVVGLAENFEPIALIGAGGIGKTSIALAILHHNRIKDRFGYSRRFIRCDQFPASRAHFLARLSKVIGAGVENPDDLTPLRPFLSSQGMLIVLDNAESILDPQGTDAQEIYDVVDELCRFETISVCITSRITDIPRHCKRLVVPTLSMEAGCDTFYSIYNDGGRSDVIKDLLQRVDYHALSITLLATTASQNMWNYEELAMEWDTHRAQVLQTDRNESLAATIELSLTSPTFQKLGADARELLGVVAFFPQGVDKKNLDWLFPTIPDRKKIFDKFCALSLTHRVDGFITMLAPIRDYLGPRDPRSSSLLLATKDRYFARLSVNVRPQEPGFEEAQWIRSEDVNVEHLLDVFTSVDADAVAVLDACARFMEHLYWYKPRHTVLRRKIEGIPDDHPSKTKCLTQHSRSFQSVGNYTEWKRILSQVLTLERKQGSGGDIAGTLRELSEANRLLRLREEGIRQIKEAFEIYEQLGEQAGKAWSLGGLAQLLMDDNQLDAAEEAVTYAIDISPEKGQEFMVCQFHELLGKLNHSKGKREKAIHHFEVAIQIASPFNFHTELRSIHHNMAMLFREEGAFDDAQTHIEQAKLLGAEHEFYLGRAADLQALIWCQQGKLKEAKLEILRGKEIYEKLGLSADVQHMRDVLEMVELLEGLASLE